MTEETTSETIINEDDVIVDGADAVPAGDAMAALENELAEARAAVLYAQAETQNVRRRMEKDAADARAYAATGFARAIM